MVNCLKIIWFGLSALLAMSATSASAKNDLRLTIGTALMSDHEGSDMDDETLVIPIAVAYRTERLSFNLATVYLTDTTTDKRRAERSGMGDARASIRYSTPIARDTWFDVSASAKVPSPSPARRFGTGTFDVDVSVEIYRQFGPIGAASRAGYRFVGSSDRWNLSDTSNFGASLYTSAGSTSLGMHFDRTTSPFEGMRAQNVVALTSSHPVGRHFRIQTTSYTSQTHRGLDFGFSTSGSVRF